MDFPSSYSNNMSLIIIFQMPVCEASMNGMWGHQVLAAPQWGHPPKIYRSDKPKKHPHLATRRRHRPPHGVIYYFISFCYLATGGPCWLLLYINFKLLQKKKIPKCASNLSHKFSQENFALKIIIKNMYVNLKHF